MGRAAGDRRRSGRQLHPVRDQRHREPRSPRGPTARRRRTWASIRPAGGAWGAPEQVADDGQRRHAVAMSATGDAVVLLRDATPGCAAVPYRPGRRRVGRRCRGDRRTTTRHAPGAEGRVRRDGPGGRAGGVPRVQRHDPGQRPEHGRDLGRDRPGPRRRRCKPAESVVRRAQSAGARAASAGGGRGLVAPLDVGSNFNDDIVVSRLSAARLGDAAKVFDLPNRFGNAIGRDQRRRRDPARRRAVVRRERRARHPRVDRTLAHRRRGRR